MSPPPLLEVVGLSRTLQGGSSPLWEGISFSLQPGDVLFIRGPSGIGKTLLLRSLALLDPAEGGTLRLRGQAPSELGIPAWRSDVIYVHQSRVDFPGTPLEFFELAQKLAARRGRPAGDLAAAAAAMGLDPSVVLNQKWASLSGGQAQRASLAVAAALRPAALLLDEPTSACDPEAVRAVEAALAACGAALVWVTHDGAQPGRVGGRQLELPGGAVSAIEGGLHPQAKAAAAAARGGGRQAAAGAGPREGVEVAIGP
ncbi:hypothetical protein Rsub_06616 [Raphidocelis subcapitata]|uniref:ABC transporter domain-containing protein n=1 Tax=Raphidocelis subcapitata TaxID=307507 RepID=A0A2V0P6J2_9CHLO|nr:hypothetical protein Rsub_06616 [Raphidocelis subcapitata]|eukprot:GBF93483.1 hypothetical protein Rsub_06616 [Raphidocelis subcapitata]